MLNLIKKKPTGGKPVKQNTKNKNKTLKLLYLYKKIKNVLADKFVKSWIGNLKKLTISKHKKINK